MLKETYRVAQRIPLKIFLEILLRVPLTYSEEKLSEVFISFQYHA